jgi:hypothetical protein
LVQTPIEARRFKLIYTMHEKFERRSLRIGRSCMFPEYKANVTLVDGCNCLLPEIRIISLSVPG